MPFDTSQDRLTPGLPDARRREALGRAVAAHRSGEFDALRRALHPRGRPSSRRGPGWLAVMDQEPRADPGAARRFGRLLRTLLGCAPDLLIADHARILFHLCNGGR